MPATTSHPTTSPQTPPSQTRSLLAATDLPIPLSREGLLSFAGVLPAPLIQAVAVGQRCVLFRHVMPLLVGLPGREPADAWERASRGYARTRRAFVAPFATGCAPEAIQSVRREAVVQARALLATVPPVAAGSELTAASLRHLEAVLDADEIGYVPPGAASVGPLRCVARDVELALVCLCVAAESPRVTAPAERVTMLRARLHGAARDAHALAIGVRPTGDARVVMRRHPLP